MTKPERILIIKSGRDEHLKRLLLLLKKSRNFTYDLVYSGNINENLLYPPDKHFVYPKGTVISNSLLEMPELRLLSDIQYDRVIYLQNSINNNSYENVRNFCNLIRAGAVQKYIVSLDELYSANAEFIRKIKFIQQDYTEKYIPYFVINNRALAVISRIIMSITTAIIKLFGFIPFIFYTAILISLFIRGYVFRRTQVKEADSNTLETFFWFLNVYLSSPHNAMLKTIESIIFSSEKPKHIAADMGRGNGDFSEHTFNKAEIDINSSFSPYDFGNADTECLKNCYALNIKKLPFVSSSISTIFFVHSIDHIKEKDEVITEVSRVLCRSGRFVFSDVSEYFSDNLVPNFIRKIGLRRLAEKYIAFQKRASLIKDPFPLKKYEELAYSRGLKITRYRYFMHQKAHNIWCLLRLFSIELYFMTDWYQLKLVKLIGCNKAEWLYGVIRKMMKYAFIPYIIDEFKIASLNKGGNIFIVMEKQIGSANEYDSSFNDISDILCCPLCNGKMTRREYIYACQSCNYVSSFENNVLNFNNAN